MSSSQERIFEAVLKRMTEAPNVDWDAVAKEAGYGSAANAKTMFNRFRKKLAEGASGAVSTEGGAKKPVTPRKTQSTPRKKDSAKKANKNGMDDDEAPVTPAKASAKKKRGISEVPDGDDEADGDYGGDHKAGRSKGSKKQKQDPKVKSETEADEIKSGAVEEPDTAEEPVITEEPIITQEPAITQEAEHVEILI